ncbi:MAG: hypothetical protein FWF67_01265 [Fibromonadales bacterium]|nr:hypothetical protein [Fibromonadales bacterium]MCL1966490.1 hypothetical protein [Fibromonadales bacterium]
MRLFPKMPGNSNFWRKWNVCCIMFTGSCLLAIRFFKDVPDVVDSAEDLMWFGFGGLILGFIVQFFQGRK